MKKTRTTFIALFGVLALVLVAGAASAQGVLFVKNDKVGIGTDNPTSLLDVKSDTPGATTMARFTANGAPFVFYKDESNGEEWSLRPTTIGDFTISRGGTGGVEFVVRRDGRVQMGPGPVNNFTLGTTGNLTILGTLTENSSRSAKENFAALDGRETLARIADLDVVEWSYKNQGRRHIGPMAEDFYAAFGLGTNGKGLAPRDLAGVTLVALQGLNEVVEEKDQQIEQLSRELAELRAMVESLAGR